MDNVINLGEKLGDFNEIILNFRSCCLVRTGFNFSQDKVYYLVDDFLLAKKVAQSYGNSNFEWLIDTLEVKRLYNLTDEDIEEIEIELK